ncbi:hypothetical protein SSAG_01109 [Streptomyces sp. Mg1]|nr:hypothetical protein SSAG_01109 [Streptomyces sp. Mg1]
MTARPILTGEQAASCCFRTRSTTHAGRPRPDLRALQHAHRPEAG